MVKKFISYYKKHKTLFFLDMFSAFCLAIFDLLIPLLVKVFIDNAIGKNDYKLMVIIICVLIVTLILTAVFNYIVSYYGHVMGTKIERDMRQDLFAHFQTMDSSFFTKEKVGRLMSRLVGDLRDISEFTHHGPEDIFLSVVMLSGSFFILFKINVIMSLILIVVLILMLIFTLYRRKRMNKAFRYTREFHAELNSKIENSLSGISVMKSYTNEDYELEKFIESNDEYQGSWDQAYFEMGVFNSSMQFMLRLMSTLIIIYGGYLTVNGKISAGDLAAFILYIAYFTKPIHALIGFFDQYNKGWSGFERLYQMLQIEDEIKSGNKKFTNLNEEIGFNNIEFKYEDEVIIKNFNLKIKKGQSIALVGKTGVGKSTIAKLIPRFYDVTSGSITLDGVNINEFDLHSLRSNIGYVEQDSYIFFGTIRENILYGNINATNEELIEAAKKARIDEFVNSLPDKYESEVGDKGIKLSGGQKQRISLARMFLKNPNILVLDEATSALDNNTEVLVQNAIEDLSEGRTSIIIAHRLTTITNCDVIYVLDRSGIVEFGSHEELMKKQGSYYDMYTSALKDR